MSDPQADPQATATKAAKATIADDGMCRACGIHCGERAWRTHTYGNPKADNEEEKESRLIDVQCEECVNERRRVEFRTTGLLTSRLTMEAAMWGFDTDERPTYKRDLGSRLENWRWELQGLIGEPPPPIAEAMWAAYRRHLRDALAILPERGRYPAASIFELVDASVAIVERAKEVFATRDAYGNFVPQPRCYQAVNQSMKRIQATVKDLYEPTVWYGGLKTFLDEETMRGHSALGAGGLKVLSFVCAGRAMQTLSMPIGATEESITLITDESSDERGIMGVQGIDATERHAIDMLRNASELWAAGKLVFTADKGVSLI